MKAKISEIFKSIQGEGLYQGLEQVFVRFYGCSLSCKFCDTKLSGYREYSVKDLTQALNSFTNFHSISLTGGEPLEQVFFLKEFLESYRKGAKKIYLETNGILFDNLKRIVGHLDIISMDFKLSSSTGIKAFWHEHREFIKIAASKDFFIKAVIGHSTLVNDIRIALSIIKESGSHATLVLQPENPFEHELAAKLNYFYKICQEYSVRVKIISQLHKVIGVK
ncbi:MAG: 7-carboxy-7-deazaguanine synthase QueE [Candidatus Omnitrophica bacterium]|nr:7-carboxy-7-deazaguanine synthase QueE [Candidatus Omnitrophota bacterium]